ncbi:MAG: hypothetical protein JW700_03740 [Candidatus Aenigmarchaeota archaeon]|nr:hypothetical protein [Candidatus Aenigmarchaeota archaeon]
MVLTKEKTKKINDFVYLKPRSIDEVAKHMQVNWRTANRYVDKISSEQGTISTKVFRGGTRGALKVVFWNNVERLHSSEIQERLFNQIVFGKQKKDFSPTEIVQFVDKDKKKIVVMSEAQYNSSQNSKDFADRLRSAEKQIMFFSGNLTFSNIKDHDKRIHDILEELGKRKVQTKILTSVELAGIENIQNVLSINSRTGYNSVEMRHCYQPLRTTIIDSKVAAFKEVLDPHDYAKDEMKDRLYVLYYIYDQEWIEWLQKVFWHLFRRSIDAKRRIEELELLK